MNAGVLVSSFLAATIEVIEMVAIVVAVGVARSWRAALAGACGGLGVLAVLIAALGSTLRGVPLDLLRLLVGALLLVFGSQWLRKGILRVCRRHGSGGRGGALGRRSSASSVADRLRAVPHSLSSLAGVRTGAGRAA